MRAIRALVDDVLRDMSREFDRLYARGMAVESAGAPAASAAAPIFYAIRSERLLMEQLDCNLLFAGLSAWTSTNRSGTRTVFTKNRDRLLNQDIAVGRGRT